VSVIRFRLERAGDDGYAVEPLDEPSRVFTDFVASDLLGREGLEEMLARARAVLDASEPSLDEVRNRFRISVDRVDTVVRDDEWDRYARCTTTEFVAFLAAVLDDVNAQADA